ncbi:hypothetical protein [Actinocorallia populi]|uniref:hypothetical protein n=1 Tax=Actinocorallia populi TaxID=2079200 RepID=UPI000D089B4D|nr:hypothetical protein [Actinocorallia populi]
MLEIQLSELLGASPEGVEEALGLVAGFDDALVHGFARLDPERLEALEALAAALAVSPIGEAVAEAVEKLTAGSVTEEHLAVLAGGRAALLGAVHDALLHSLDAALGRDRDEWTRPPAPPVSDDLLGGCRAWLHELAITGWRGVGYDLVSSADRVIEALFAVPALRRPAVLLDGLASELRAFSPVGTAERLPVRRWADLWSRALLLAQAGGRACAAEPAEEVSGRLLVLGVDVHEHDTAVQIQVHAVLEPSGGARTRLVRASAAAAKVDTIAGPAVWRLLSDHPVLLGALAERRVLEISGMPLLAGGDLVWQDGQAAAGEPADPFTTARVMLTGALAPAVPPLERHPVRIAEPVLLEGYTVDGDGFRLGDRVLDVDFDRLPSCGPLTSELVKASSACVGLVRWDAGRWKAQPLAVQGTAKRKPFEAHTGDWALGPTDPKVVKAEARSGDSVAVLRERAGRLLRR